MLSLVATAEKHIRYPGPSRAANAVAGVRAIRAGADNSARESLIRIRQRDLLGFARVTTRSLPSAVAASAVYRSGPKVSRRGRRGSTSMLYSHGPAPSGSLARYISVRRFSSTG